MSIKKAVQTREESARGEASDVAAAESSAKVSLQPNWQRSTSSMSNDLFRSKRSEDLTSVIKDMNFNLQEMQSRHNKSDGKRRNKTVVERFAMKEIREKPQAQLEFSQVSKTLKNDAMIAELDNFMAKGRMDPTVWFEDNRLMKESVDVEESP